MVLYVKGMWERGTFTVPDDIPEERIRFKMDEYRQEFGNILERRGYTVLEMTTPTPSTRLMKTEPGQKRYDMYARIIRKPVTVRLSIPDYAVPHYQRMGLKLLD